MIPVLVSQPINIYVIRESKGDEIYKYITWAMNFLASCIYLSLTYTIFEYHTFSQLVSIYLSRNISVGTSIALLPPRDDL